MREILFKKDEELLYEDGKVAVELLNGEAGATIVVYNLADGVAFTKHPIAALLEDTP